MELKREVLVTQMSLHVHKHSLYPSQQMVLQLVLYWVQPQRRSCVSLIIFSLS